MICRYNILLHWNQLQNKKKMYSNTFIHYMATNWIGVIGFAN